MKYEIQTNQVEEFLGLGFSAEFSNGGVPQDKELIEIIELATYELKKKRDVYPCVFENGEEKWMVSYPKYKRVQSERDDLRLKVARLKEVIDKLTQ